MKKKVLFLLMANVVIIVMIAFGLNIFFNKDSNGFEINDAEGSLWLESVGNDLVGKSSSLTNSDGIDLVIPEGTTEIARNAYKDRTDIKSVTIPNSVTSIGWYAFQGCTNLTSIIIPSSVTSIGSGAFKECTSLVDVTISDGVEEISTQVFMGCTSLESIIIPSSVTEIGTDTFSGCTSLKSIEVAEDNSNYKSIDGNLYNKKVTQLKQYAIGKSDTTFSIPSGVTSISLFAFLGCTNLTNITIPNTVTNINNCAFEGCTNLTNIIIPDSVTLIEAGAFANCTSLTKIVIPKSVTSLGSGAFRDCTNIKKILIRNGNMSIDRDSFSGLTNAKIFIEANETDVYWDIQYGEDSEYPGSPSWRNGNEVYFIGGWIETSFYDQNGKLIFTDYFSTTDTITTPTPSDYTEGCYTYTFVGWDINDDGIVDTLPETSTDNITAKAVYSKSLTNVTHHDKVNPTCTTKGNIEYWTCETCGKNYLDKDGTTEVTNTTIDELKHNYEFSKIEWTNFTAKAIYVCSNDSTHTESHDCEITSEVINKATCVATGTRRYTATYSGHTDTIDEVLAIDPNNHSYLEPTYEWSMDNLTCTAKRVCSHDESHIEEEVSNSVKEITQNRTCTLDELSKYTVTFTNTAFTLQIKEDVVTNTKLGHNYEFSKIEWTNFTAKAIYVCSNDSNHTVSHDCEVTSEVINKATCVASGIMRYTATYSGHTDTIDEVLAINPNNHNLTHHDKVNETCTTKGNIEYYSCSLCNKNYSDKETTTEVSSIIINELNHNYVFNRIEWNDITAKAIYVCINDSNHTVSHDCEVTSEVINKATCVASGLRRYTATYSGNKDTKDETLAIDSSNHNLTHHYKVNETCTTKGNIEYYSCSLCNKNYSDEKGTKEVSSITINELNHNYVFSKIEWNGFTAKAIYVCSNDSNHTESHDCEVTSEVINKATCVATGLRRYTATYSGNKDTIDEVLAIDPNNHNLTHHDGLDATCTAKGSIEYYSCSLCNKNYSDKECTTEVTDITIDALGHNYSTVWSSDKDHHFHECSRCHVRSEEESHIWDSGVVTKEATTKEEGKKTYTCKTCNETKEETIPVKSGGCKIKAISFSSVILGLIALVAVLVKKKGWLKKFIK